jgi:uncharacterized protein
MSAKNSAKREIQHLMIRQSPINGLGCFAAVPIAPRRKIGEFLGEKITAREARTRVARGGKISICEVDHRWSIDASRSGNPTAFINHSCNPNGFTRIVSGRIYFFALRSIVRGEEITLDYTPSLHPGRRCTCGSPQCRGVIG